MKYIGLNLSRIKV